MAKKKEKKPAVKADTTPAKAKKCPACGKAPCRCLIATVKKPRTATAGLELDQNSTRSIVSRSTQIHPKAPLRKKLSRNYREE